MARPSHAKKEVEQALRHAESMDGESLRAVGTAGERCIAP
jgi:hypothetical protein